MNVNGAQADGGATDVNVDVNVNVNDERWGDYDALRSEARTAAGTSIATKRSAENR